MSRTILLLLLAYLLPTTGFAENRQIKCELYSAASPSEIIEALQVNERADGSVLITSLFKKPRITPVEFFTKYSSTTDNPIRRNRFSTVVTQNTSDDNVYIPLVWLIDWDAAKITNTHMGYNEDFWSLYTRYRCVRMDRE